MLLFCLLYHLELHNSISANDLFTKQPNIQKYTHRAQHTLSSLFSLRTCLSILYHQPPFITNLLSSSAIKLIVPVSGDASPLKPGQNRGTIHDIRLRAFYLWSCLHRAQIKQCVVTRQRDRHAVKTIKPFIGYIVARVNGV